MREDGNEGFRLGGQQSGDVNHQQGSQGLAGHHPGAGRQGLLSLEVGALVQAPPGLCDPDTCPASVTGPAWGFTR